jgi:hypothetical protein
MELRIDPYNSGGVSMATRITINMFSGRPNPSFVLDGEEERELLVRLAPQRAATKKTAKASKTVPAAPSILGYRGIEVEQLGKSGSRLPSQLRVFGGRVSAAGRDYVPADKFVEDHIAKADGILRTAQLRPEIANLLGKQIDLARELVWTDRIPFPEILRPTCPCAPLYEPAWWNDGGQRQHNNNCYNYAANYRTDTFAQPGKGSGQMYGALSVAEVRAAAIRDDVINSPKHGNKCPKEGHLIALVIAPAYDFHWYRRGRFGRWTHKPGGTQATDRDNSGKIITNPQTADRGPYTQFAGFMTIMHGHIKLR